ncbi:GP41 [Betabaculovirus altermyunipunctae]|uniref:GP41 n=1 Tax=Betabaculovirus altermyunipunctae TaxID=3051996 RepID=A0A1S5YED9_9BBAC|nr:GP41 [Betabaculovirus altermyunipunctae]AQQ80378.1 GP41 [Betabaculovirus altermyunipunctae]
MLRIMADLRCLNVHDMIKYYRSNDVSNLGPEDIELMNLIRDMFIHADPLPVTVTKKFENDEQLIEYYKNLEKKYQGNQTGSKPGPYGVFDKAFVISPIMKSYADKFYKRRLNLAATHLSNVIKYQMATAITQSRPLPIVQNDATDEYIKLLSHKAGVSHNVKRLFTERTNARLNMCVDVFNNLVADVLMGAHDGYYINNCLGEEMREKVLKFKDDVAFLMQAPLNMSTNAFALLDAAAVKYGKQPTAHKPAPERTHHEPHTSEQQSMTELAFENEALRRGLIQQLNSVYETLS